MGIYRTGEFVVSLVFLAGAAAIADVIATAPSKVADAVVRADCGPRAGGDCRQGPDRGAGCGD